MPAIVSVDLIEIAVFRRVLAGGTTRASASAGRQAWDWIVGNPSTEGITEGLSVIRELLGSADDKDRNLLWLFAQKLASKRTGDNAES